MPCLKGMRASLSSSSRMGKVGGRCVLLSPHTLPTVLAYPNPNCTLLSPHPWPTSASPSPIFAPHLTHVCSPPKRATASTLQSIGLSCMLNACLCFLPLPLAVHRSKIKRSSISLVVSALLPIALQPIAMSPSALQSYRLPWISTSLVAAHRNELRHFFIFPVALSFPCSPSQ